MILSQMTLFFFLIILEEAVMEGTPVCGTCPCCESNSNPNLHHGAAVWAAVMKPGRVTLPWDELHVRMVMGLRLSLPAWGFRREFDQSKGLRQLLLLILHFGNQHVGIWKKKKQTKPATKKTQTKKPSVYQLTCLVSLRPPRNAQASARRQSSAADCCWVAHQQP